MDALARGSRTILSSVALIVLVLAFVLGVLPALLAAAARVQS